jgi:hypothetical protein
MSGEIISEVIAAMSGRILSPTPAFFDRQDRRAAQSSMA